MIIFPDLSYEIIGAAFKVFNTLGYGLPEKNYGRALALELTSRKLRLKREVFLSLTYNGKQVYRGFADFIIEEKILVELKVAYKLGYAHIHQLIPYLKASGLKLGILIYFTSEGVKYRRVLGPS